MSDVPFLKSGTKLGAFALPHRVALAPMTRCRTTQPGNVPNAMMAEYYGQRATAALMVTEATQITPQGQGYSFTPGIHSDAQIAGWRLVTDEVHKRGGIIFNQLWHVGRMSHESFHPDGKPVAPSAIAPGAQVWIVDPKTGQGGMVDCPVPRALSTAEVQDVVRDFGRAAANAKRAGFDGVEVHGANGYLLDEFLRASANQRTDQYGGSPENRIRFILEVARAVIAEIGADRVGFRFSPHITQRGMNDPEAVATFLLAARELGKLGIAYIHIAEADWDDAPPVPESFRKDLRAAFPGTIIVAGGYDRTKAEAVLAAGHADLVAFGRHFIGNPDLPRVFFENRPVRGFDGATLFGGTEIGYTDYPALEEA